MTLNDLKARFNVFMTDLREMRLLIYCMLFAAMSTATQSTKRNNCLHTVHDRHLQQHPAVFLRQHGDSTAFLLLLLQ